MLFHCIDLLKLLFCTLVREQTFWSFIDFIRHLGHYLCTIFYPIGPPKVISMCLIELAMKRKTIFRPQFGTKLCPFYDFCVGLGCHVGGHLGSTHLDMSDAILMCFIKLLIYENLHFATNFIKLSALEQKLWPSIDFDVCLGGHFGGHLGFTHLAIPEVIFMYLIELLIHENLYFATNFMKLSALEQKLWPFIVPRLDERRPFWNYANLKNATA